MVGNWVNKQFQLDALGEVLLLFAAAARHDHLDTGHWRAAGRRGRAINARWRDADAGIWELERPRWTHSRLTCVAGLRAVAEHRRGDPAAAEWSALADTILADAAPRPCIPTGRWQRSPADARTDAALLLPPSAARPRRTTPAPWPPCTRSSRT